MNIANIAKNRIKKPLNTQNRQDQSKQIKKEVLDKKYISESLYDVKGISHNMNKYLNMGDIRSRLENIKRLNGSVSVYSILDLVK